MKVDPTQAQKGRRFRELDQGPGRELAVERVRAAAEVARSLPFRFTLTARAENFLVGRKDLADTIGRLQAFQEASFARAALGGFLRAAREVKEHGTFTYGDEAVDSREISQLLKAAGQ